MKQSTKTVWHDNVGFSRSLLFLNACLVDSAWNSILNMKCKGMEGKGGSAKELSWWEMLLASTLVGGEEKRPNLICKSTNREWSQFLDFARIFLQRKWKSDYGVVSSEPNIFQFNLVCSWRSVASCLQEPETTVAGKMHNMLCLLSSSRGKYTVEKQMTHIPVKSRSFYSWYKLQVY